MIFRHYIGLCLGGRRDFGRRDIVAKALVQVWFFCLALSFSQHLFTALERVFIVETMGLLGNYMTRILIMKII